MIRGNYSEYAPRVYPEYLLEYLGLGSSPDGGEQHSRVRTGTKYIFEPEAKGCEYMCVGMYEMKTYL